MKNKNYIKYILFIIIGYAIFLRVYNLGFQSFWIDEGFSGFSTLDWSNLQYYIHNLSQLISFNIFGISDLSARLPSVIFSVLNILFIYLISINLFRDKKQAIFAILIFSFLTWEIIWARQARFYTLLQLLFSINLYLLIKIVKDFSFKYLYLGVIFLYIGILFHPFLYSNVVLFVLGLFYLGYLAWNKLDIKSINYRKYLMFLLPFLMVVLIELFNRFFTESGGAGIHSTFELPDYIKEQRFGKYYLHLFEQLGVLLPISLLSMLFFVYKKKILEIIIFSFATIFIFYVIAYEGKMYHTRYMLILFPIFIISSSYLIFYIYDLIKDEFLNKFYIGFILILILSTANFAFLPKDTYYIDYTSPQPNFKGAYNIIPKGHEVVSGFPMLCKWYYKDKGECKYSLPLDYVGDINEIQNILDRGKDNYTNIEYLINIEQLEKNKTYYFVFDDLTVKRMIDRDLLREILKYSKDVYDNGDKYNNIIVVEYFKK